MSSKKEKIPPKAGGIYRIIRAGSFSWQGFKHAITKETAFQQEFLLNLILQPLGWYLPFSIEMKLLLSLTAISTLIVELLNSSIEAVVDIVCEEYHPLAKVAKDMGSLAVLISFLTLAVAWGAALYQLSVK